MAAAEQAAGWLLVLRGGLDEGGHVGFQLGQVFVVQIHHVSGVVVLQVDVFLEFFGQAEVLHGVFGGNERSGQIVQTVFDFDLKVRVGEYGLNEIAFHVRRSGEAEIISGFVLPVPRRFGFFRNGAIFAVLQTELKVIAQVGVESGGIGSGDGVGLRIGLSVFGEQVVGKS